MQIFKSVAATCRSLGKKKLSVYQSVSQSVSESVRLQHVELASQLTNRINKLQLGQDQGKLG